MSELRITTSTAYRVYYTKKDEEIIVLLIGGDKSTQSDDIKKANEILKELDNE
ncbi:addiction module killer protein [Aliarcobacter vitoriensis]|uniref:Addiction module killer protein n=1 Tax=Aliarcobacter vitoriensis TaxID=2011099 RepID=A0A366MUX3_9BACT|nr:addiction module killer protein [Aliarcobacter vitoriensis]